MFKDLLRIIFPSLCISCENALYKSEEFICSSCHIRLHILPPNEDLNKVLGIPEINIVSAYLDFDKKGITQTILHQIKYKKNLALASYMGGIGVIPLNKTYDYIIPVPLHPKKQKLRGYNQSEEIANGMVDVLKCKINNDFLKRIVNTETQTKKTKVEREKNQENAFTVASVSVTGA